MGTAKMGFSLRFAGGSLQVLLLTLSLGVVSAQPKDSKPSDYLVIKRVDIDTVAPILHVTVKNVGVETITAYVLVSSNGAQPFTEDFFSSIAFANKLAVPREKSRALGGIRREEEHEITIPRPGDVIPNIEVATVIFFNRTAVGDETKIQEIFSHRNLVATEYARWCSLTQESLQLLPGPERRSLVQAKVKAVRAAETRGYGGAEEDREFIASALERAGDGPDLLGVVSVIQERCTVSAEHSRRAQ